MSEFAKMLGGRIKEMRAREIPWAEARLSQDDLAELAGISRITLSRYERGQQCPSAEALAKIACALNVSTDYLLFGEMLDEKSKNDLMTLHYCVHNLVSRLLPSKFFENYANAIGGSSE